MIKKILQEAIKKAYEDDFRRLNTSLESIGNNMSSPQKIEVETDNPLKIEVVEQEQKRKGMLPLFLSGVISFIILTLSPLEKFFINPLETRPIQSNSINGFIYYPEAVSIGDEEMIGLMLTNRSKSPIEEVKSLIIYPKEAAVKIISNNGSSVTNFKKMDANETKTNTIKFRLEESTGKDEMKITLKIISKTESNPTSEIFEGSYPIPIHGIPRIKSILFKFLFLLGILLLTPLFKKVVENFLQ